MISINIDHPASYTFREESNSAEEFATFLVWLLEARQIQPGDGKFYFLSFLLITVLILDNARIHTSEAMSNFLFDLIDRFCFTVYFLPT